MYDVALSFSGESRCLATQIARDLEADYTVFLDADEATELWGAELLQALPPKYLRARLCIMLITDAYIKRFWPAFEREVITTELLRQLGPVCVLCARLPTCTSLLPPQLAAITIDLEIGTEREHIVALVRARLTR